MSSRETKSAPERLVVMPSGFLRLSIAAATLLAALPAVAQPASDTAGGDRFKLTVGGGALYQPSYLGSDHYDVDPLPLFDLRYADRYFLSTRDGLGANLAPQGSNLKLGPVLKYRQ